MGVSAWTLTEAQEKLATWMAADDAIAQGQEYRMKTGESSERVLKRADAGEVQKKIEFWRSEIISLKSGSGSGGPTVRYVNP